MITFDIQGTDVSVEDLLNLQMLAVDIKKIRPIPSRSRRLGEQRAKARGQGREFIEMKHYQQGDDVRQIDWRQTAKKQSPFVRVMEEDRHSEHVIWLHLNSRMYFGTSRCFKSVLACHWAAFLIWRFQQIKHPVRLLIQTPEAFHEIRVVRSNDAARACRLISQAHSELAGQFQRGDTTPEPPHWKGHPHLWVISDFMDDQVARVQRAISMHPVTQLICLQTLDQFDLQLPNAGTLPVKAGEQTGWLQTDQQKARDDYQQIIKDHALSLNRLCLSFRGLNYQYTSQKFHWQEVHAWPLYH
ncbi:MAG: DUF58 domain-containing protein [Reinekea sp.]|jgi:uncharacterized protein (DUF58 family)